MADIGTQILFDTGQVINALPSAAGSCRDRTGFMHEVRREGLDL